MGVKDVIHAVWRGVTGDRDSDADDAIGGRILLLIAPGSNRDLMREYLARQYEIIEPEGDVLSPEPFDLAIVDAATFRKWFPQLTDAKSREEPTFLPVILLLPRNQLRHRLRRFWEAVDEFVVMPVDRNELSERVAMLLRARRLAVSQRARLAYLVNHDRATGLPNKILFMDRLTNVIRDASLLNWKVATAVIHIPLARILKSFGHIGLEKAAVACSNRLRKVLGEDVYLARLTTEEWVIIHHSDQSIHSILDVSARIQHVAESPLQIDDEQVHISPRVGISIYPDDATNANELLDRAMSALSETKTGEPVFYSSEVQRQALRFIRTEARLHEALAKNQLELWYQPQMNLDSGEVVGVEALVRWRLENGKLVPPGDFIPVAEAAGLIQQIDRWVLQKACSVMSDWQERNMRVPRISVNVSAEDINQAGFASLIEETLANNKLPPPYLELEITETMLFEISEENMAKLNGLRKLGVSIAVDDFGTGYSSLSYLHKLPINTLKIDKSFVDHIDTNRSNEAVATTIVWLARNFKLETVAEGIETEAQADKLRSMGVITGQGYLYARPMPEDELVKWLKAHRRSNTLMLTCNE